MGLLVVDGDSEMPGEVALLFTPRSAQNLLPSAASTTEDIEMLGAWRRSGSKAYVRTMIDRNMIFQTSASWKN